MAGGPTSTREEMETSLAEELNHGSQGQNQEHLVIAEVMEHGSRPLGVPLKRQKLEPKAAGSAAAKPVWNMTATRPKKMGTQLPMPRMLRESGHGDAHFQECPGSFQGTRFHHDRNPETGTVAETGLEEFNGLEMEIIKKQLCAVSGRLRALEEQDATWRQRETLIFALLVSASIANLWLWMHQ
ncbi:fetal and adult testis-expressed transcript protein [Saimiri boliviensis]|uniref:Fetal and adult testis expressed 1 n=1 Tax=Saimiri boliviensis boliviensis TaxID=39432 RepID=A0A2K6TMN8_SAIBB|nr:fetal and adult testis-expressed transcript protein [Saimiri boliviensis boliviensis]